jgi:dTMP kinase
MNGLFITFEGTEGGGKSTQIVRLAERLTALNLKVRQLREPGGTPVGEEIRHLLKHSEANRAMTPEAELLLMNAQPRANRSRSDSSRARGRGSCFVRSLLRFDCGLPGIRPRTRSWARAQRD